MNRNNGARGGDMKSPTPIKSQSFHTTIFCLHAHQSLLVLAPPQCEMWFRLLFKESRKNPKINQRWVVAMLFPHISEQLRGFYGAIYLSFLLTVCSDIFFAFERLWFSCHHTLCYSCIPWPQLWMIIVPYYISQFPTFYQLQCHFVDVISIYSFFSLRVGCAALNKISFGSLFLNGFWSMTCKIFLNCSGQLFQNHSCFKGLSLN